MEQRTNRGALKTEKQKKGAACSETVGEKGMESLSVVRQERAGGTTRRKKERKTGQFTSSNCSYTTKTGEKKCVRQRENLSRLRVRVATMKETVIQ